ncbi:MAG: tol-pal system protein YbgF [Hyphomicrobiales bacterium]|nr:tol-pal system protein YbgF [Hyphomicrobiales bacterium]
MVGFQRLPAVARLAPLVLGGLLLLAPANSALAQMDGYPPGGIPNGGYRNTTGRGGDDSTRLLVRIDRLENRVRTMTGQIEQLQFQMRQMQKKLESFQKDVDFRFKDQSGSGNSRRSGQRDNDQPPRRATADAEPDRQPHGRTPDQHAPPERSANNGRKGRDAFNPADHPNAPGAPVQLGSPLNRPSTPLTRGPLNREDPDKGLPGPDSPIVLSRPLTDSGQDGKRASAGQPAPQQATPREVYRQAVASLKSGRYQDAETGFKDFMKRFPRSSLAPSVLYNLGITYASRSRHREAAEQFLKVSTDYRKSSRAPESLYRLGISLERLGAREQACASYAEVERRYPRAPGSLRARVDKQIQKAKC